MMVSDRWVMTLDNCDDPFQLMGGSTVWRRSWHHPTDGWWQVLGGSMIQVALSMGGTDWNLRGFAISACYCYYWSSMWISVELRFVWDPMVDLHRHSRVRARSCFHKHLVFHWIMFTYTWWSACRRELVLSLCYCFHVWCRSGGNTAVWSPTPTPLVLFVYLSRERGVNTWQTIHSHTFFLSTNTSISIRSLLATCVRSRAQVYYLTCTDACIHVYNIINYRTNLFVWWKLNLLQ